MTGKGSLNHNSRKFHAKNTDPNRTHWNVEYCNEDGKRIVLIPDGKNNHKFTKSGRTKNTELIRTLKKKHIGVPATFEMERYMDSEIWIGEIIKIKKNKK